MVNGFSLRGLVWRLRAAALGERAPRLQFECRNCGHSTSRPRHTCPDCGAAEMARYEL